LGSPATTIPRSQYAISRGFWPRIHPATPPGAGWLRGFGSLARRMAHSVRSRFSASVEIKAQRRWTGNLFLEVWQQ
jgi:hypothetical protein